MVTFNTLWPRTNLRKILRLVGDDFFKVSRVVEIQLSALPVASVS